MDLPKPATDLGVAALAVIAARPSSALLAFDFDGVLSPIVADPATSRAYPGIVDALRRLLAKVGNVAIISGRPAADVIAMADFGDLTASERFSVFGLYGMQRWDTAGQRVVSDSVAPGIAGVRAELPGLIAGLGLPAGVAIEDKSMSIAVHTRRSDAPAEALAALLVPLGELAERHGLALEPGRLVLELRTPGSDKGLVLTGIVERVSAGAVAYFGDDLGDLPAFAAVDRLRAAGVAGLKICSGSDEVPQLKVQADVVVDGPAGVLAFVNALTEAAAPSETATLER
jgi:trehalose 6-phosphate phosphatase